MHVRHVISMMLVVVMTASVLVPSVDASSEAAIDISANILDPLPAVSISLDVASINFGIMYPGEVSDSVPVAVSNVGSKAVGLTVTVEDDGDSSLLSDGIYVDGREWSKYYSPLAVEGDKELDVTLNVPDDAVTGRFSGSIIVWAEEKSNIYSTAMENTNPGAPDAGIPGFVGPDGDGVITTQRLSGAIPSNNHVNPIFTAWASKVIDYYRSDATSLAPSDQFLSQALGPVTGNNFNILSLGDLDQAMIDAGSPPGSLTLGFDVRIVNGPGPDFAAFENGFIIAGTSNIFAELGYVEVSTDGITFVRFPSVSLTSLQPGGYGGVDPTGVYNLVGKHVNAYGDSWGTPFDLSDLVNEPEVLSGAVDLDNINFVRIVDIPGNGYFLDSLGNPIYDAWPTWGTGGLDFEALGVINSMPKQIIADFSTSPLSGNAPLTVHFTDLSIGATSWAWDFDNDGTVDSTEQNPTYTYNVPSTYTVKLTASNSAGSDIEIKRNLITVSSPLDDFIYDSTGSSITITGYKGAGGDAVIPGEIGGVPVVAIGASAFKNNANMTSVTIPSSVTSIGTNAFQSCTVLTSVTIGSGVTSIPANAFTRCTALTDIIVDAANSEYTSVDEVVYDKAVTTIICCPPGRTSVTIPSSVTSIDMYAFQGCIALTSIEIPDSVTSIGLNAFNGCTALESVTIPDSVTSIGDMAFNGCISLTTATIGSGVTKLTGGMFNGCTALTSVTIGSGVTSISSAFYGCTALTSVTIPSSVKTIGAAAFRDCTSLTSMTFSGNAPSVGASWARDVPSTMIVYYHAGATGFVIVDGKWNGFTAVQLP